MADTDGSTTHTHVLGGINVKKPNAVLQGMARHPNICAFVFALIFTIIVNYGDSFNSKPVVTPPRQPQFLFPPQVSVVLDSSRGSLQTLVKHLQKDEFIFVMFYAPWCSKSLAAKAEFEKAAVVLYGKVTFAAVNCWWPEGECSKRYKFLYFPTFLAYHTTLEGYRYTGPTRADHIVKFVEDLIHPVSLVHTHVEVQDMIARYDSLILGYFNLMGHVHIGSYRQFYYASMRILERDPRHPVHFAVTANSSIGGTFQLDEEEIILIRARQISLIYPYGNNISCTNLVNWALRNKDMPTVSRLYSSGLKSQALSWKINEGPAVIVFHHENPLFKVEQGMNVIKDVALQYQSCLLNKEFKNLYLNWRRLTFDDNQRYNKISTMCQILRKSQHLLKKSFPCCFSTVMKKLKTNWYICEICQKSDQQFCNFSFNPILDSLSENDFCLSNCCTTTLSYQISKQFNVCCQNKSEYMSDSMNWMSDKENLQNGFKSIFSDVSQEGTAFRDSKERRPTDRYYLDNLEHLPRCLCDHFSLAKLNSQSFPHSEDENVDPHLVQELKDVGCHTNRTLNFYAMDSQMHWMVIDRLGINKTEAALSPSVVIFDKSGEEHYVMKENFSVSNTMSFIVNFQKGNLKRHQNSDSFNTSGCEINGQVCVHDLDSKTFLPSVKAENKDVVVLIYAHWCGFCQSLSHTFLALAQYFSTSKYISFMRINGATNDLPWEYTVESFPKILFFPADREPFLLNTGWKKRKPDSIMFPSRKEKTLINLIQFVLSHSTYDTKLLLASDVCSKSCIEKNINRSNVLLQKLTWRYKKVFISIHSIAHLLSDVSKSNPYLKFSYDFLNKRLNKLSKRIKNVRLLVNYLENNSGGSIAKEKLISLFQADHENV